MELGLRGKRAIVTGGATGIGKAIAEDLAKEGVSVTITSRNRKNIDATLQELEKYGRGHYGMACSITDEDGPANVYREIQRHFGDPDIVVNNVGDTFGITDPHCPTSDLRKLFRLNLEVHVEVNNLCIPAMKRNGWGRIVNVSAGASMENSGPVPYCSVKAALTAYSRCMGRVLAPEGIVMSALLPGVVFTEEGHWATIMKTRPEHAEKYLQDRCPLKRFGQVSEISPMAVLLCSNLASFCVGSIVPVDGGQARHYFNYSSE